MHVINGTFMKAGKLATKFNMMELREAIVVNPAMVLDLLENIPKLSMDARLPLKRYAIHTSIQAPFGRAFIFDKDCNRLVINFTVGPDDDMDFEDEDN